MGSAVPPLACRLQHCHQLITQSGTCLSTPPYPPPPNSPPPPPIQPPISPSPICSCLVFCVLQLNPNPRHPPPLQLPGVLHCLLDAHRPQHRVHRAGTGGVWGWVGVGGGWGLVARWQGRGTLSTWEATRGCRHLTPLLAPFSAPVAAGGPTMPRPPQPSFPCLLPSAVQSTAHSAAYLESRVEAFLPMASSLLHMHTRTCMFQWSCCHASPVSCCHASYSLLAGLALP